MRATSTQRDTVAATGREPGYRETASRILDVAERLVAQRGFNAVSYADIAAELQMTKPALHYHFAGKADLGRALIERYGHRFQGALDELSASRRPALAQLSGYADLYLDVLRSDRMCLCGLLAAEFQTLPEPMQQAVVAFFDANETWLQTVLHEGRGDGSLRFSGPARDTARLIIGCLEGAMLLARSYADPDRLTTAAAELLAGLTAR